MKYLILFIIFFSFNVFAKDQEMVFKFSSSTCSNRVDIEKIFISKNTELIFKTDKILKPVSRKLTLTNNSYKGVINKSGGIELKGKYGNLVGYYNLSSPKIIILTFDGKKNTKYTKHNNCGFFFKFPGKIATNESAKEEKIIKSLSTRVAKKIHRTTGGDLVDINVWALNYFKSLDFMKFIDKISERNKTENKVIALGITKFSSSDENLQQLEEILQQLQDLEISNTSQTNNSMDGEYMLFWRSVVRRYNTEVITDVVVDIVRIKNGELDFVKINKDHKIQQENREKIIFKLKKDHFIITGNLDLNTVRKTQPVYIKGSAQPNNKGQYVAETLYDSEKVKFLNIIFQPIFNKIGAAKVCLYHASNVKQCERSITCAYKDNIYTCSREYEKVESQCTYLDGIYSCNGKIIDVIAAQKKAEAEEVALKKAQELAAKKKKEDEFKKKAQELAAKKKKEEEEVKKKAQELAAKKKKEEEEVKKKAQELAAKKKKEEEIKQKISKKVQEFLFILGFYKGSIDGSFGKESLQALNEWRIASNLNKVMNIDEINEKDLLLLEKNTDAFIQNKKKEELSKKKAEEEKRKKELAKLEKEKQIAQHYINDLLSFIKTNPNEFDIITLSELMVSNKDILEGKWDKKLQQGFELLKEYTKTVDPFVQFLKDQDILRKEALIAKIAIENAKITNFINNSKNYLQNNITSSLAPEILKQIKLAEQMLQIKGLEKKKEFNEHLNEFITKNNLSDISDTEGLVDRSNETDFAVNLQKVQEYLKILNLYEGPIDGSFGPASLRSLNQWQKDNNLEILLSIYEMNEKQFNYLEQKVAEFTENIETSNKLKLEKYNDKKRLAQIFINDLLAFIKTNRNEFDIITLTELMVSNKDILDGKWDDKLQKDFELLNEYTLKSELFNKFHLTQNENRRNLLIAEINNLNNTLNKAIEYFKFYLKNNITSSLAPDIIKQIKIAEKGISREDKEEKIIYLDQLISFINSNELSKDYTNFTTTTDDLIQKILDIAKLDSGNEQNLAIQKIIEGNLYPISEQEFIDNYTDKIIIERLPYDNTGNRIIDVSTLKSFKDNILTTYFSKDGYFSFLYIFSLNSFVVCDGSWVFKSNYMKLITKNCYEKEELESVVIYNEEEYTSLNNFYRTLTDSVAFFEVADFDNSAFWILEKIEYDAGFFIEDINNDLTLINLHKNLSNLKNFVQNYTNKNYELDLATFLDKSKSYTPTDLSEIALDTVNKLESEKDEDAKNKEAELAENKKEKKTKNNEEELAAKKQKEKKLREKQLARNYINDLLEFIKTNPGEFDIITLSGLLVSNKDILDGKWSDKLQKDYEQLKEFTLISPLFEKYHLSRNENRKNQLIAQINKVNENLHQTIDYFTFYLQNNMTSSLVPEILEEIKHAEKGIATQDLVEKNKQINQSMTFIISKKLRKDYYSFLDSIKPQVVPKVDTSETTVSVNNNKLLNIDLIKEIDGSDLVVLANLSGKAPNAIRNLSGETIFENNEAILCFYQSKKIPEYKRFYYYDKIPERKFLINTVDLECRQDQLLNYDLILFIKKDLLNENQEYVSKLITQIQSGNFEKYSVISQKQYEEDILERQNFSKQIKKDIIDGVRLGYGSVAIKNDSKTLCSDIKDNQATHKSIINLLKNEYMRLGYGKIVEKVAFKDKEKTFIDVQRDRCGFLYVGQDSFQDFIKGFEKAKTEYEIMPVWYSTSQIAAEQERLDQIENQRLIDLQKKKEDKEKKELLEKEKLISQGKIKSQQQEILRENNRNIVESYVNLIEKEIENLFVEIEKLTNEDLLDDPEEFSAFYNEYKIFSEFILQRYHEGWRLDNFDLNFEDYGMGTYRNRKISTFITRLNYKLRNDDLGDYFPHCLMFGMMHDKEFKRYRESFVSNCEEKIKRDNKGYETWDKKFYSWKELNKYKKRHSFKTEWIVN